MGELTLYLNEEWHTRKIRQASAELVDTAQRVLNDLTPPLKELDSKNIPLRPSNELVRGFFSPYRQPGFYSSVEN